MGEYCTGNMNTIGDSSQFNSAPRNQRRHENLNCSKDNQQYENSVIDSLTLICVEQVKQSKMK